MIVSWEWLQEYVDLTGSVDEVTDRLTMSGLNLEGIEQHGDDKAIDLEVTSNRSDCLGHIGVAREIAVLFDETLRIPAADVAATGVATEKIATVTIECEDLCPQYHARVIRGVRIGPSPKWLVERLAAVGIGSVNNVVDVTNFVMLECGQPLHAFDHAKLHGGRIVVRRGRDGETLTAIDHVDYRITADDCVIADADRPVAIAGVMGGADTEISDDTTDVLIEVADFAPLTVRNTARRLKLFSPSQYRFERGVDREGLDWASRRCCELILETAGGQMFAGGVVAGTIPRPAEPVSLRFDRVEQLLGIPVSKEEAVDILQRLGCEHTRAEGVVGWFTPPSWRRDLTREADLIEEVARIHGYEKIPVDAAVPMSLSSRTHRDRVRERIESTLIAGGFNESLTLTFVTPEQAARFDPHGVGATGPRVEHSTRKSENVLRPSLVPSLLTAARDNERKGNFGVRLFEFGKVFLAADPDRGERETEPLVLALVGGLSFADLKGIVSAVVRSVSPATVFETRRSDLVSFNEGRGAELWIGEARLGWIGEIARSVGDELSLRDAFCIAELDFGLLEEIATLVPVATDPPQYPAIDRDLNFVLDESVAWSDVERTVRAAAGPLLETVGFGGQYRGKGIPAAKKSYVVSLAYRSLERTLTNDEVESAQNSVVAACESELGATLRS